ncbi:hypothetical protein PACILC2_05580 [Paenibacillus cisolokensis]|uniref:Uncharacterized protein n=1 Tax=Paenibacillus cisolokensis TaxID=1658519 RepID=A0ABQ4N1C6_9BACL|nr:hypothetical protein PACILC2_05580 [Paenibacillus cisolokensis]
MAASPFAAWRIIKRRFEKIEASFVKLQFMKVEIRGSGFRIEASAGRASFHDASAPSAPGFAGVSCAEDGTDRFMDRNSAIYIPDVINENAMTPHRHCCAYGTSKK